MNTNDFRQKGTPPNRSFQDQAAPYAATLRWCRYELIHWTGHPTRVDRDLSGRFGDDAYAAEELVAELGAAFTAARLGLTNTPRADHIAYLGHWLRILKADPKALFAAASQAQRAVDYIANLTAQSKPADVLGREVAT